MCIVPCTWFVLLCPYVPQQSSHNFFVYFVSQELLHPILCWVQGIFHLPYPPLLGMHVFMEQKQAISYSTVRIFIIDVNTFYVIYSCHTRCLRFYVFFQIFLGVYIVRKTLAIIAFSEKPFWMIIVHRLLQCLCALPSGLFGQLHVAEYEHCWVRCSAQNDSTTTTQPRPTSTFYGVFLYLPTFITYLS